MSAPNPSTHEPEVVMYIESNAIQNIQAHVDTYNRRGMPLNTTYLRQQARLFDSYLAKLEEGAKLTWSQHLDQEKLIVSKRRK